ncbi:hypothetical protein ACP3VS_20585 [Lysinibacillus sp. VIII_CA]
MAKRPADRDTIKASRRKSKHDPVKLAEFWLTHRQMIADHIGVSGNG